MKIKTKTLNNNQIFETITKLHPEKGDVLFFEIATDEYGTTYYDADTIREMVKNIDDFLGEDIKKIFLLDKFYLYDVDSAEAAIERLQNCIAYLQDGIEQLQNVKHNGFEWVSVNMKDSHPPIQAS